VYSHHQYKLLRSVTKYTTEIGGLEWNRDLSIQSSHNSYTTNDKGKIIGGGRAGNEES
jgi:hypothetical protein